MVPAGMENLISAPLVKKLDKEEEQVRPRSGPSELRGCGVEGPGALTPALLLWPGSHHVQQVPAALSLSVHAMQCDPAHPQEARAAPGQGCACPEQAQEKCDTPGRAAARRTC